MNRPRALTLDSPFDLQRQMRIWIAEDIPEPDSPDYARLLPPTLLAFIRRTQGKALVLFTSVAAMQMAARALREDLEADGIRLLVQGSEYSRHDLLDEFKRDIHSVLFGLDSFWMGVDVPGEALEHVIITTASVRSPDTPARRGPTGRCRKSRRKTFFRLFAPGSRPQAPSGSRTADPFGATITVW